MKKITRANIIGELVDKFSLEEFEKEPFLFSELVVPIYDVGEHTKKWVILHDRKAISTNGVVSFHLCPLTEKWMMRRLIVINETGGNFDIDQIFHYNYDTAPNDVDYIFYNTAVPIANGIVEIFEFPQDIVFTQGFRLNANISNYVAGGYVSIHMLREVEIVR